MHLLRSFGLTAVVCAATLFQPIHEARAQAAPGLKELAEGKQLPQTLKLKDFQGDWQRLEASVATNAPSQVMSMMGGGPASDGDTFYTQGQTITLGTTVFLIAYRPQLRRPSFMDMMMQQQQQGRKAPMEVLTLETPATLTLVNFQLVGAIMNLKPLDVAAEIETSKRLAVAADNDPAVVAVRANAKEEASRANLKQLAAGVTQFSQDLNLSLPSMKSAADFKKDILPYVKADQVFVQPISNEPYLVNPFLQGKKLQAIVLNPGGDTLQPSEIIFAYEATPTADGARNVAYLDGHVKKLSATEWTDGKAKSRIP